MMTDSHDSLSVLARSIARRFDLEFLGIAIPLDGDWNIHEAGARLIELDKRELSTALAAAHTSLEFDVYTRTYAGHRTTTSDGRVIRLVPLRDGRSRLVYWPPPGARLKPGRWIPWPELWPSPSSARSSLKNEKPAS